MGYVINPWRGELRRRGIQGTAPGRMDELLALQSAIFLWFAAYPQFFFIRKFHISLWLTH